MGSSKKHKKHKSERREKYEEYSNNMDPAQLQRGLKLILKVGANSTPEYGSGDSPAHTLTTTMSYAAASDVRGPPTAAEAMMSAAPSSELHDDEDEDIELGFDAASGTVMSQTAAEGDGEQRERHKKSKKKKKKKDREKKHKHHKEKRHRGERHEEQRQRDVDNSECRMASETATVAPVATTATVVADNDSSQDGFSFIDENSQPLPENILFYAGMTTDNSPSCRPVSKAIVPRKTDEQMLGSPGAAVSPTKPLPDLLIPTLSPSTAASTPGGAGSCTPKPLEAPRTPSSCSESGREPRTCVLKLKQQKSPLNKLLEHLLRFLEKRDPHQFFAWPVTDDIAPGYSSIISKPMDFSTMRQRIDDNEYATLNEFSDDFRLMCENAIRYNHVDTVYHKAAKRLLQVGLKQLQPESLMRSLKPLSGYMRELTAKELGFELQHGDFAYDAHGSMLLDSADEGASTGADEPTPAQLEQEEKRRALRLANAPKTRYEPYVDDLTSEEILAQVQNASRAAKQRLTHKQRAHKMGFLRQQKDGTTSLQLLLKQENEGPEQVVTIGDLVGKLATGSGQLQGLREDKRNEARAVKPLNYGAFASFAPAFDSRFSQLSKEQTQLVLRTYAGDGASAEYAESMLQFTRDSNYASMLANGLLDVLTQGDHSKAMGELYETQCQQHEQKLLDNCFGGGNSGADGVGATAGTESRAHIEAEYEKYKNTMIDFKRLRTLNDLGIDMSFLDDMEAEMKNFELTRRLQEHLSNNLSLIEKLSATQHERLSQPLPAHLAHVPQPGPEETHLAQQLSQQLTDLAKKLPPAAIADTYSVRRAMGMSYVGLPPPVLPQPQLVMPEILQQPVAMPPLHLPNTMQNLPAEAVVNAAAAAAANSLPMDIDEDVVGTSSGVDLENELREFLESGTGMSGTSSNVDDNNIVAQLLMN